MERVKLDVEMFGEFSVYYGEQPIIHKGNRNSDAMKLFQLLLLNRNRILTQEELMNTLYHNAHSDNHANGLKNLISRLRKLLTDAGLPGKACISYQDGGYILSDEILYQVDVDAFTELVKNLQNTDRNDAKTLEMCLSALEIYKGNFLSKLSGELWVESRGVQYQDMYTACLKKAYDIAVKKKKQTQILDALRRAITLYPYDDELHMMYISCLYDIGHTSLARQKYEEFTGLLFKEFEIAPTVEMQELYKKIMRGRTGSVDSITDISQRLILSDKPEGAYYCDFEGFSNIYQFVVRHIERSGQSVYLMLCTVTDLEGISQTAGTRMSKIAAAFKETARITFRKGDVYTRYGPSQFLFILMNVSQKDCDVVANRVKENFDNIAKTQNIRLACRFILPTDMDQIMQKQGFGFKK